MTSIVTYALFTMALVAWRFKETITTRNPNALHLPTMLRIWGEVLRHPTFRACALLSLAAYGALFTYLASSSFIFIQVLHISKPVYGLMMFLTCLAYILGTWLCRRLLPRMGIQRSVALAAGFSLAGGTLIAVLALLGIESVWAILAPMMGFMLAHGVLQPCSQSGALGPFPFTAGAASALNGLMMVIAAFLSGSWLGTHMDGSARPLTYGVAAWSAVLALAAWTVVRRYGRSSAGTPA
jgi:DHA1 family bicyclomycin/chloramphenicol resistance-like MFS transporter